MVDADFGQRQRRLKTKRSSKQSVTQIIQERHRIVDAAFNAVTENPIAYLEWHSSKREERGIGYCISRQANEMNVMRRRKETNLLQLFTPVTQPAQHADNKHSALLQYIVEISV